MNHHQAPLLHQSSPMRLLAEPALAPAEGSAPEPMAFPDLPADPSLTGHVPPGVLANQQRAREEEAEFAQWCEHDARWQVFHRLRELSVNHAFQAWRRRYRMPLSAYALAFLFTQPAGSPAEGRQLLQVRAATRVWKQGPESANPVPLLKSLTEQVRSRDPRLPWDLRTEIANRSDDGMTADAVYLGLGLSTLDTNTGTFAQVCQSAHDETEVPGGILYLSTGGSPDPNDQQVIVAGRRGTSDHNVVTIHAYRALTRLRQHAPYPFAAADLHTLYESSGHGHILRWMWELDYALHQADEERRDRSNGSRQDRRGMS